MTETEARRIASKVEPKDDSGVSVRNITYKSVTFDYTDFVNTHYVPEEYRVVGVGSGWFAIEPRE